MKNVLLILLILATGGCNESWARTRGSESNIAVLRQGDVFKLIYDGVAPSIVEVIISDNLGNRVFKERIFAQDFIRPYNLSQLPKGDYEISVDDGGDVYSQRICSRDPTLMAHIAKVKSDSQKFLISVPDQGVCDIAIRIYDNNKRIVHQEERKLDGEFAKVYHLKNLPEATIEVTNRDSGEGKVYRTD